MFLLYMNNTNTLSLDSTNSQVLLLESYLVWYDQYLTVPNLKKYFLYFSVTLLSQSADFMIFLYSCYY